MICNNCKNQIMDNAVACPYCGAQFIQQQPMGQPGVLMQQQQPMWQPMWQPDNYKSPVGFIVAIIFFVFLITLEIILFIAPGFITKKYRDKKIANAGDKKIVELASQTTQAVTEMTTEATTEETTEATTQATTEATTQATTEATTQATTEASVSPYDMAQAYSTTARPDLSEFDWYVNDVMINGMWSDAKPVTDPLGYEGGWKCFCFWDPDNVMDAYGKEWCNANITVSNSNENVSFTFDYYMVQWGNEAPFDISGQTITYMGELSENGIYCSDDNGSLEIYGFYSRGDKEYAIGFLIAPSGEWANVALVRP